MRCPKCGYNSFDHLETCKKCNKDLAEHKARFNIQSILLSEMPVETASAAEEAVAAAAAVASSSDVTIDDFAGGGPETDIDDFGFDFMGDNEDDENVAFDELFEEVPAEDEVEESLPAPDAAPTEPEEADSATEPMPLDQELAAESAPARKTAEENEFSFDASEPEDVVSKKSSIEFGFDSEDDPDADIFAESEEDFSLDAVESDDTDK